MLRDTSLTRRVIDGFRGGKVIKEAKVLSCKVESFVDFTLYLAQITRQKGVGLHGIPKPLDNIQSNPQVGALILVKKSGGFKRSIKLERQPLDHPIQPKNLLAKLKRKLAIIRCMLGPKPMLKCVLIANLSTRLFP